MDLQRLSMPIGEAMFTQRSIRRFKPDPIPMEDYYALYGIFESTRYSFPGSEQKQRLRALVPLVPPEESQGAWRQFEARVASLKGSLDNKGQPPPSALLRSLDEMDGDFEIQAPANGGSRGVLVPLESRQSLQSKSFDGGVQEPREQGIGPAGKKPHQEEGLQSWPEYKEARRIHPD